MNAPITHTHNMYMYINYSFFFVSTQNYNKYPFLYAADKIHTYAHLYISYLIIVLHRKTEGCQISLVKRLGNGKLCQSELGRNRRMTEAAKKNWSKIKKTTCHPLPYWLAEMEIFITPSMGAVGNIIFVLLPNIDFKLCMEYAFQLG